MTLLCITFFSTRKSQRKRGGYSEFDDFDEDGIYETVSCDVPVYEVQTVAIEMGAEEFGSQYGQGVWQDVNTSESLNVQTYHNAIYDRVDSDITVYGNENATLENCSGSDTMSLSGLSFETVLVEEIYESPFSDTLRTAKERKRKFYKSRSAYQTLVNEGDMHCNVVTRDNDAQKVIIEIGSNEIEDEGIYEEVSHFTSGKDAGNGKMDIGGKKSDEDDSYDDVVPVKPDSKPPMDIFCKDNKVSTHFISSRKWLQSRSNIPLIENDGTFREPVHELFSESRNGYFFFKFSFRFFF